MNIQPYAGYAPRGCRFWSREEDNKMRALSDKGVSRIEIAQQLAEVIDRTEHQIMQRLIFLRPYNPMRPAQPTIQISKADLPAWYAAGWRVSSFDGDAVKLEWPYARPAVTP